MTQQKKAEKYLELWGKLACAIVSMKDLELIEALENQIDVKAAQKARRRKTSVPWEKAKKQHLPR